MKKNNKKEPKYSYGNDIEFHLFSVEQNKFVSAIPVLKHDKDNPIDLGDGINLYYDNILVETSFLPYYSKAEMFERLQTVISRIQKYIGPKYRIVPKAAHTYDASELQDPIAQLIGCSANYDAYSMSINEAHGFPNNMRTTGYHCHIGNKKLTDFQTRIDTIKALDILVGVPAVIYENDESEIERRKIYGRCGEHRPCNFGLEYRPLSSSILNSKEAIDLNFDLINYTLSKVEMNKLSEVLNSVNENEVKQAMTKCDKQLAERVLQKVKLPEEFMNRIKQLSTKKHTVESFYKEWDISIN